MHENKLHIETEKWLDEALKADPGFSLSEGFADKLATRVSRRFAWAQYLREFAVYVGVVVGMMVVLALVEILVIGANYQEWIMFAEKNISLLAGANILLIFILFADKVLLQYFMFRSSGNRVL